MQDNISNESRQPTQQPQDWWAEVEHYSPYWVMRRRMDALQDYRTFYRAADLFTSKAVGAKIRVDRGLMTPAEAIKYIKEVAWKEVCAEMSLPEPKTE